MKLPAGYVSLRAASRELDMTLGGVQKAIDSGRVTSVLKDPKGRRIGVHLERARIEWAGNTDPTQAERTGTVPIQASPVAGNDLFQGGAPDGPPSSTKAGKEDPHGYLEHRARTEEFRAKQAELEYLKDLGILVPIAEVREANFSRYRTLRDKMLNIPDRVATILAAERDPTRVHVQLTEEIKRVLSELSIEASAAAAEGAAERVAA